MSEEDEQQRALRASNMRKALDSFDPHLYAELQRQLAKEQKIKYDALIAAGFSTDQAISLIK
jgi:hypothetical protein